MPRCLKPTMPLAPDVLLPGDPGRALLMAQELLETPKMSNHARGLWGYTGAADGGRQATIQSSGMGAPSVIIVLADLEEAGVRRAVRTGTCGALDGRAEPGEILAVERALAADGIAADLADGAAAVPDRELGAAVAEAVADAGGRVVTAASSDLDPRFRTEEMRAGWVEQGAVVEELECAALFALGERLRIATAALLLVTENGNASLENSARTQREIDMGRIALAALAH